MSELLQEARVAYVEAREAQLSDQAIFALGEIAALADSYRADRITATRFVLRLGVILSELEQA